MLPLPHNFKTAVVAAVLSPAEVWALIFSGWIPTVKENSQSPSWPRMAIKDWFQKGGHEPRRLWTILQTGFTSDLTSFPCQSFGSALHKWNGFPVESRFMKLSGMWLRFERRCTWMLNDFVVILPILQSNIPTMVTNPFHFRFKYCWYDSMNIFTKQHQPWLQTLVNIAEHEPLTGVVTITK